MGNFIKILDIPEFFAAIFVIASLATLGIIDKQDVILICFYAVTTHVTRQLFSKLGK